MIFLKREELPSGVLMWNHFHQEWFIPVESLEWMIENIGHNNFKLINDTGYRPHRNTTGILFRTVDAALLFRLMWNE